MKTIYFYISVIGLFAKLLLLSPDAQAQVNLKSISVGASYWKPSLNYWNERSILTAYNGGQGATLGGQIMPNAALEIGLVKGFSVGVRAGYWKSSAASNLSIAGINRTEKLTLSIIPVSVDVRYSFDSKSASTETKTPFVSPYIGVGLSRYFIKNEFSRVVSGNTGSVNESEAGNNYGVQVFVGAERKLVKKLYVALDVRYHVGSYNQQVQGETTSTTEKVSLNGLEAGLALRVKFAN
ncbi:hypothetical protein [Spirosoma sp. KNUC1025]|uniref:hypothetical protein n=1 Tax=Spirosoma sp. KNUC1025 TaxID=2894082 RepID=UPI0038701087|nr:outer membrane beta-barrel protein [Spirosoma sp. KNUC1025]